MSLVTCHSSCGDCGTRHTPGSPLPPINNSTQFQAYIPYFYDILTGDYQARVDQAIAERVYMSLPDDPAPIHAHFGQDVVYQTLREMVQTSLDTNYCFSCDGFRQKSDGKV